MTIITDSWDYKITIRIDQKSTWLKTEEENTRKNTIVRKHNNYVAQENISGTSTGHYTLYIHIDELIIGVQ